MYFDLKIYSSDDDRFPLSFSCGSADNLEDIIKIVTDSYNVSKYQLEQRGLKR